MNKLVNIFFFLLLLIANNVTAAELVVFGPQGFSRDTGPPITLNYMFNSAVGEADLIFYNGDENGNNRVSSATISINGAVVVSPDDLSPHIYQREVTVTLKESNTLAVRLYSKPESYLFLTIVQEQVAALPLPLLELNVNPPDLLLGESATLTWTTEYAETCVLEPDLGSVSLYGSLVVAPDVTTTYTVTAINQEGVVSQIATVTVAYPQPVASLATVPQVVVAGEPCLLVWSTQYAQSCVMEPDIGSVPCAGEMTVFPQQDAIYILTATSPGGIATSQAIITVSAFNSGPLALTIDSPIMDEEISRPDVQVRGTVSHDDGLETGVTVNGSVALLDDGQFVASHVSLQEGENNIIVRAVDINGQSLEQNLSLTVAPVSQYVELIADTESGFAPMQVSFNLQANFPFSVPSVLTVSGSADVEIPQDIDVSNAWTVSLSEPGLYIFDVEVVDDSGASFTDSIAVLVMDSILLDAQLQEKWNGMTQSLLTNQIDTAVSFFATGSQEIYKNQFYFLSSANVLSQFVDSMGEIRLVEYDGYGAIYDLRIIRDDRELSFQLLFAQDIDGVWRIKSY